MRAGARYDAAREAGYSGHVGVCEAPVEPDDLLFEESINIAFRSFNGPFEILTWIPSFLHFSSTPPGRPNLSTASNPYGWSLQRGLRKKFCMSTIMSADSSGEMEILVSGGPCVVETVNFCPGALAGRERS